jgi:peptide/nickel transport system permease protein
VLPSTFAFLGAFPYFWLAMVALYVLGFSLGWFPLGHAYGDDLTPGFSAAFLADVLRHAALPVGTVVLATLGGWLLTMRNTMVAVLGSDYVNLARQGLRPRVVLRAACACFPASRLQDGARFVLGSSLLTRSSLMSGQVPARGRFATRTTASCGDLRHHDGALAAGSWTSSTWLIRDARGGRRYGCRPASGGRTRHGAQSGGSRSPRPQGDGGASCATSCWSLFGWLAGRICSSACCGPIPRHWLGTTGQGQDVFAQLVAGTRVSLAIGFAVGLAVVLVGALVGVTAGFFGGRVDGLLSLLFNVFLVIPGLPLAIVIAAYLPSGPLTLGLVLVVTGWAWNARVVRAQTLALRERDFVAAAVVAGESSFRIVTREILPNMTSLLVAQVIGSTVYAIGAQVGLEFLGLGDVSTVTWGTNLYWAQNDAALLTGAWWTFAPTGLCVALVGFGLTMLNSGFDEITNPRLQLERAWRAYLRQRGQEPARSTPVVVRHG